VTIQFSCRAGSRPNTQCTASTVHLHASSFSSSSSWATNQHDTCVQNTTTNTVGRKAARVQVIVYQRGGECEKRDGGRQRERAESSGAEMDGHPLLLLCARAMYIVWNVGRAGEPNLVWSPFPCDISPSLHIHSLVWWRGGYMSLQIPSLLWNSTSVYTIIYSLVWWGYISFQIPFLV